MSDATVVIFDEWKDIRCARDAMLKMSYMMEMEEASIDVRDLKDVMFMITGEEFSTDVIMQVLEEMIIDGTMTATIINTETIIIGH